MTRGKFISVEGIEGAGKSTQVQRLVTALNDAGVDTLKTREPGGSPNAERLRTVFLEYDWDGVAESFLLMANRRDHVVKRIRPMLDIGTWVVSDRFSLTTLAYQGHGRGVDRGLLLEMDRVATGRERTRGHELMPDLTIVLDLPAVIGLERARTRSTPDRMERLDVDFFERVRAGFLEEARRRGGQCVVVNAWDVSDVVHHRVVEAVREKFGIDLEAVA